MEKRIIEQVIREHLALFPAVTLLGPRQCGKTTVAQSMAMIYFDLEQEQDRKRLLFEWEELIQKHDLIVLDEAQAMPEIFPKLRGAIDADRKRNGRFLLLGSVAPALMKQVSESLAGRLGLLYLTPFLSLEVSKKPIQDHWLYGGYPNGGILNPKKFIIWQKSYIQNLTQRDLPLWGLPAKPQTTERLLHMLTYMHGQTWNASQIAKSLAISQHTVNDYVDFLTATFLIRKLQPYSHNLKKRLVKSPKIYFRDTGLLHTLLDISSIDSLLNKPFAGASWEGFVIEQILGLLEQTQVTHQSYYYRTYEGEEIDLVLITGEHTWAIEIKLSRSIDYDAMLNLKEKAKNINTTECFVISQAKENNFNKNKGSFCNVAAFLEYIKQAFYK